MRERWTVALGGAAALLVLLYVLVWEPLQGGLTRLRSDVTQARTDLAWMRQAALDVRRLSAAAAAPVRAQPRNESLLTRIDQSARAAGLGEAVKRVEPQGEGGLRVQLEQVGFDQMLVWLSSLEREQRVAVVNVVIDRQPASGRVNARLILQENAS